MRWIGFILLLAMSGPVFADLRPGPLELLRAIKVSKSIALVDLVDVVKKGEHPDFKGEVIYLMHARLVEKWRGPFPNDCQVQITLFESTSSVIKSGDRAILFVSSDVDPLLTAKLEERDFGHSGKNFWWLPKQKDGEFRLASNMLWFGTSKLDYRSESEVTAFANHLYPVVRDLIKSVEPKYGSRTDFLFDDDILEPSYRFYDKGGVAERSWLHRRVYWGMFEIQLSPKLLYMAIEHIYEEVEKYGEKIGKWMRERLHRRLNERKPGDQVPEYLRNLPKDDDEAIKQAHERFLREYAKDKKDGK